MTYFRGAFSALPTPFKDGKVDFDALKSHVEEQIKGGIKGLVPCGTTGESATLSHEEHCQVIECVIETADQRVLVLAGTGSNSTEESIKLTKYAEKIGADGSLLISPYYNKPTQEGLYQHYKAISESTDLPLVLYNVPGRTALNMEATTIARLSELKNIVGVKEATGNLAQVSDVIEYSTEGFQVISGDDFVTLPMINIGAVGTISVTSNIIPTDMSNMCKFALEGNQAEALKLHFKMMPLNRSMFLETNPLPVKTALSIMGKMEEQFRLPLCNMSDDAKANLKTALGDYGLL